MDNVLAVLFFGFLVGVLVISSYQQHRERKKHDQALEAVKAAVPKMAEIIAGAQFEQHRILQRMMAQGGIRSTAL